MKTAGECELHRVQFGLTGFQIKIIALAFMTLDHLAAFLLPWGSPSSNLVRAFGRIAAPLFLYMVAEGLRHTHSKTRYMLQLYLAGVVIEIANRLYEETLAVGVASPLGNILPTFFYVALFSVCMEKIMANMKRREYAKAVLPALGVLLPCLLPLLYICSSNLLYVNPSAVADEILMIVKIFAPSPFAVEYTFLFILLGLAWYFFSGKRVQCVVFALLCICCALVPRGLLMWRYAFFFNFWELFTSSQWCMIMALPFIILYKGEKGRSMKYFFYLYYPLHQYLLYLISLLRFKNH